MHDRCLHIMYYHSWKFVLEMFVARVCFIQAVYGNIEEKQGHVNQVVKIARRKGILNRFIDVIMNGCFLYKIQWKNIVKEKSCEYDKTN